jgi:peptidoglycan/LPS O-acetylase OafA/YrhL
MWLFNPMLAASGPDFAVEPGNEIAPLWSMQIEMTTELLTILVLVFNLAFAMRSGLIASIFTLSFACLALPC